MMQDNPAAPYKKTADVIVAGGGHNGLVAACYLARSGLDVLVVEAHDTVGGMTCTNPMAPEAPDHLINEASIHASLFRFSPIDAELELSEKYGLRQRIIDPCHVQLDADSDASIGMWRDPLRMAEEIRHFSPKDAAAYIDFANLMVEANHIGLPLALTSATKPEIGVVLKVLGRAIKGRKQFGKLFNFITSSHAGFLEEVFEHDMTRACFTTGLPFMDYKSDFSAFAMVYIGVLSKYGVAMFEGGTQSFPNALVRCLEAAGGQVRTDAPVEQMIIDNGRVTGVRLKSGEAIMAKQAVMTAFSPKMVLNHMIPPGTLPDKLEKRASRIPTKNRGVLDYKLNIALKGKIFPKRHQAWRDRKYNDGMNLRLPTTQWMTYQESLKAYDDCIRGEIPDIIGGLAQITTAFDPSMAPPGHDTFWFWSGLVPADPKIGWDKAREEITHKVVKDCAKYFDGIEALEIGRRALAPPDIEKRFHAIDGSVYHVEPYLSRFGAARPTIGLAGYKTPVPGLWLSGSGTHPSAGISGVPGRNAAMALIKALKK